LIYVLFISRRKLYKSYEKNKIQYKGNLGYASKIENDVRVLANKNISLYEAEEIIKNKIINKNGLDYYIDYGEAIHIIIEEAYNDKERYNNASYNFSYMA
jgi:hypothetical protein